MNIVYEILRKLSYLKPNEFYNDKILEYFLKSSLENYFDDNDKYEITINIKNNYLEVNNLTTNEEYLIFKKNNVIDFINKKTNEILFYIKNDADKISCITNKHIKIIKNSDESETYLLIINEDDNQQFITLTNLKVKISNKDYYELKINSQKAKIIGISLDYSSKYDQIFSYLEMYFNKINHIKKRKISLLKN